MDNYILFVFEGERTEELIFNSLSEHCKKIHYLVKGVFSLPTSIISQYEVFVMQEKKHLTPKNEVAVLSAFPIFIADYYGYTKLPSLIAKECC